MSKYIILGQSDVSVSAIKSLILKSDTKPEILCNTLESDLFSLVTSEQPDVVFLNIELPNQRGTEVCKRFKSNPYGTETPVILYGAQTAQQFLPDEVIESGAEAYFQYPFDEVSFSLQLRTILKLSRTYLHETAIPDFSESQESFQPKSHSVLAKMKAELLDSEKVYKNLVERLPDGVYKSTHQGKFVEVNNALVEMLGYASKEELLAIDIKNELYFQPEDRKVWFYKRSMRKWESSGLKRKMDQAFGSKIMDGIRWIQMEKFFFTKGFCGILPNAK